MTYKTSALGRCLEVLNTLTLSVSDEGYSRNILYTKLDIYVFIIKYYNCRELVKFVS
jgi:hypothetical protein